MNFYVASCCMFCPPVSYAFATLACSPTATVPDCSIYAAPICRPMPRHRLPPQWLLIAVSTVIAATCDGVRYFPPSKFPLGCPTHLKRRTLHDRPLPARSHSRPPLRHPRLWPNHKCGRSFNPPRILSSASCTAFPERSAITISPT